MEHDFGAQVACWYTYNTVSTVNVACGWTQTVDDAVMIAAAITEAPVITDSAAIQFAKSASVLVVFDARALPIRITDDASIAVSLSARDSGIIQVQEASSTNLSQLVADTLACQLSEVGAISFSPVEAVVATDGCTVQASEEVDSQALLSIGDSVYALLGDTRPTVTVDEALAAVSVSDSLPAVCTESIAELFVYIPGSVQNFVVSDTVTVKLNGEGTPPVVQSVSDSLYIGFLEPDAHSRGYALSDALTIAGVDLADITAGLSSAFTLNDSSQVGLADSANASVVLSATDSLKVDTPEDAPEVVAVIAGTESLRTVAADVVTTHVYSSVDESLAVQGGGDIAQIAGLAEIAVTDTAAVQVLDDNLVLTAAVGATDILAGLLSELLANNASLSAVDSLKFGT